MDLISVLQLVDQFYNSAWDKLVLTVSISFGIVWVLVPLAIQFYQKRLYNLNEKELIRTIKNEVAEAKRDLTKELEDSISKQDQNLKEEIEKVSSKMQWLTFHLQAVNNLNNNYPKSSVISSCMQSWLGYLKCEDFRNLRAILSILIDNLHTISQDEILELKLESINADIIKFIESLKEKNVKWSFSDQISEIEKKFNKLPKTRAENTTAT